MAKNKVTFSVDIKKLERDIKRVSKIEAEKAVNKMTTNDYNYIGKSIVEEMLILIAKGISPIKDAGRFPAYRWANRKSLARKSGVSRKSVNRVFKNKYPYNQMDKHPDKKERPVNLKLSGDFLENLKWKKVGKSLEIGFFKKPWSDYESGHREGVHGQPPRPIIPSEGEEFSQSIYRRLVKAIQSVFDKKK